MASRYWVGGTGTWDATTTTNWSTASGGAGGASAPTVADDAIFDANSNTGTNDFTVTLTGSPACLTLNTTGIDPATAMTVAGTGNLEVRGTTFTLTNKVSWTNTGTISFTNTAATTTNFTSAGVSIASNINMNPSAAATLNFIDALTCTGSFTLSRGTITTTSSNKSITIKSFAAATGAAKTMNTGIGSFSITGNAATVLDVVIGGGLTWTTPTTIRFTYSGATGTRTINAGSTKLTGVTSLVTAGSDTVTFTSNDSIGPLDFTGFSGTWGNVDLTINGNLTISSGMTVGGGAGTLTLSATTLTSNSKTFNFSVTSNTLTLVDGLTLGSTRTFTLSSGTLSLQNTTLSTGIFSSSGTNVRSVTRTTGNITVTGNNATILTLTGSNATYGSGLAFTCNYSGSAGTRTINVTESGVDVNISAGTDTFSFTASNSIGALNFTGFSGTWTNVAMTINGALTTPAGMTTGAGSSVVTLTTTSTLTTGGITYNFPLTINGSAQTITLSGNLTLDSASTLTLTQGTLACGTNSVSVGRFATTGTLTRSITKTTPTINVSGNAATIISVTGNNFTINNFTFNCNYAGSLGTRTFNFSASQPITLTLNISAGLDTVTFTPSNQVTSVNFSGFAGTWSNANGLGIGGNLTVSTGMTVGSGTGTVTINGTSTITSNGKTFDFPLTISGSGITATLADALTLGSTRAFTLTQGTFNAVTYNVTAGTLSSSVVSTRTLALGSGTWTISGSGASAWDCSTSTGLTVTGTSTIKMTSASAKTFAGGSKTWPVLDQSGAGALTVSGSNTFTTIKNSVQPTTITLTSGTTQTVTNFNVNGTAGNLVTLNSSSAGSQATLSDASGTVSVSYVSITDSAATGGAIWQAYTSNGNVNGGNNTGWIFSLPSGGNFLMFM